MTIKEVVFWIAVTVLATGLFFVVDALKKGAKKQVGWVMTIGGLAVCVMLYPYGKSKITDSAQGQSQPQNTQQSNGSDNSNVNGNGNIVQSGTLNRLVINNNSPAKLPQPTFSEAKSDEVSFSLGEEGVTDTQTMESLRKGTHTPFNLYGYTPVVLRAKGNVLSYDVTIWGGSRQPPIEVKDNKFTVRVPGWDYNSNGIAFEVVDESGAPIFQMIRKKPNHFVMNGIFPLPNGQLIVAGPNGLYGSTPSVPAGFSLKPIFKYPSWKYPGQYAEQ